MRSETPLVDDIVTYMREMEWLICGHCRKGLVCSARDNECIEAFATISRKLAEAKYDLSCQESSSD